MSSSSLLHNFFHKKRRRSRSPVATDSTRHHQQVQVQVQVHEVDRPKRSSWTKRRAYYRRCHQLALQDPSIGILQRHSQEASAEMGDPHASPTHASHFVDPWTRTLPYWLLMLPLYIHVDAMAQTSYAQLLAYTRALEKERNGLYQDFIKVQDRYRRFVQHVKKRTAQWDRDKSDKENKAAASANANSIRTTYMTTVKDPEPKPKSRRVTASPGRIRPEPMETDPPLEQKQPQQQQQQQHQPQIAFHPPQREAHHFPLPSHHDEANSSLSLMADTIPNPIRSTELDNLPSSKQPLSSKHHKLVQVPLIPVRSKHDPMNHEDDSQTVIPSPRPVAPEESGYPKTVSTGPLPSEARQQHDSKDSNRVSSHATKQGWISSRLAKEFVADNTDQALPVVCTANRPMKSASHAMKGPLTGDNKLSIQPSTRHASPQNPSIAPYCEVVRKKVERQALKPYSCTECGKFIDAIMEDDKDGVYNRHELMCASRHRHRFTPPDTPPDFWELSFIDERDARRQQEQQQQQQVQGINPALLNDGHKPHSTTND